MVDSLLDHCIKLGLSSGLGSWAFDIKHRVELGSSSLSHCSLTRDRSSSVKVGLAENTGLHLVGLLLGPVIVRISVVLAIDFGSDGLDILHGILLQEVHSNYMLDSNFVFHLQLRLFFLLLNLKFNTSDLTKGFVLQVQEWTLLVIGN